MRLNFSIITDTHIRDPKGDLSSPFPVNNKSNERAKFANEILKISNSKFIIHLGDMVHPLPQMDSYKNAVIEAKNIFKDLIHKINFVPGNHDIGDKPSKFVPAKPFTNESNIKYEREYGKSYYSKVYENILFIFINSSLINSKHKEEKKQKIWLEKLLKKEKNRRKFLFSHYPPYIFSPDEDDHYDNYAEPGRSWLLELANKNKVEAIFSGHVHHFFYNVYKNVRLYCLLPTSFTRQDYSEIFPISPENEYGRDDFGKFGITNVEISENNHKINVIPTFGKQLNEDKFKKNEYKNLLSKNVKLSLIPHLKHSWFSPKYLPYNGPMEEFSRKIVRNDYPVLRLIQLGIKKFRTPFSDLINLTSYQRMQDLNKIGFKFNLFKIGFPNSKETNLIIKNTKLISNIEILTSKLDMSDLLPNKLFLSNIKFYLSYIDSSANQINQKKVFSHSVSSGFPISEKNIVFKNFISMKFPKNTGIMFQLRWEENISLLEDLIKNGKKFKIPIKVNLRLSNTNPAKSNFNEKKIKNKIKKLIDFSKENEGLEIFCDTFEDIDRGYNPRLGLIDRFCNIRYELLDKNIYE